MAVSFHCHHVFSIVNLTFVFILAPIVSTVLLFLYASNGFYFLIVNLTFSLKPIQEPLFFKNSELICSTRRSEEISYTVLLLLCSIVFRGHRHIRFRFESALLFWMPLLSRFGKASGSQNRFFHNRFCIAAPCRRLYGNGTVQKPILPPTTVPRRKRFLRGWYFLKYTKTLETYL